MDVLSIQVLQGFGVKAKRIVREKSYYICNTDKGIRIIRKSFDTVERIVFQHEIKEYLHQAGFLQTDRFYSSTAGTPYVLFDDNTYVMTDFLDYRESDFGSSKDFARIVSAVARFHGAGQRIPFRDAVFHAHDNLCSTYKKNMSDLSQMKKKIGSQKRLSDFDVVFLKNYQYYLDQIKTSVMLLETTNVDSYNRQAQRKLTICHNALKEENVLQDHEMIYITGFSMASVDCQLFDLCDLIARYAKHLPAQSMHIKDVLGLYDKTNPLSREEIQMMVPILLHPLKFLKICRQYYSKKRTWTPNAMAGRIEEIVSQQKSYMDYIEPILML